VGPDWSPPLARSCRGATVGAALALGIFTACASEIVTLRHKPRCILHAVANHMGISLSREVRPPEIRYGSTAPLSEFQGATESSWRTRPNAVSNSYFPGRNVIFLTDDRAYYQRGRTLDDSLAHEYAHFIQHRYGGGAAREDDDSKEREAVQVQHWFRRAFMGEPAHARNPCTGLHSPATATKGPSPLGKGTGWATQAVGATLQGNHRAAPRPSHPRAAAQQPPLLEQAGEHSAH
jgi:hypothetical protein